MLGPLLPDQNHLLLQLAVRVQLWTDFIVEVEQLLQRLALGGHNEADDVHEQIRHGVPVEHDGEDPLHGFDLGLIRSLLQLCLQVLLRGLVGRVVQMDETVCAVQEGGHGCCVFSVSKATEWAGLRPDTSQSTRELF